MWNTVQYAAIGVIGAGGAAVIASAFVVGIPLTGAGLALVGLGACALAFARYKIAVIKRSTFLKIVPYTSSTFDNLKQRLPPNIAPAAKRHLATIARLTDKQRADLIHRFSRVEYIPSKKNQLGFSLQNNAALIHQPLGKGVFKKALAAVDLQHLSLRAHVVVKIPDAKSKANIHKEIKIQQSLEGSEFVKIFHWCQFFSQKKRVRKMGILMEFCDTNLKNYLERTFFLPAYFYTTKTYKGNIQRSFFRLSQNGKERHPSQRHQTGKPFPHLHKERQYPIENRGFWRRRFRQRRTKNSLSIFYPQLCCTGIYESAPENPPGKNRLRHTRSTNTS